jgi:diaminopimelate decarboxylase
LSSNKLFTSSTRLESIAKKYGTPLYIYDEAIIKSRCSLLKESFKEVPVQWMYAVKANDNPHILKIIQQSGFGFDTVSYEEVLLSIRIGQQADHIFYTENNMTDYEMKSAAEEGVILNIGSYSRLEQLVKSGLAKECTIRVNPQIGDGHHAKVDTGNKDSKFGIRLDLIPDVVDMAAKSGVKITGLHIHIGSGIKKPENLTNAMNVLIKIGYQLPDLRHINFGGGFPIPYREDELPFSIQDFVREATPILKDEYDRRRGEIRFIFEPGRWIVAPAGLLLTRINSIKDQGRISFIGTDTGFNHLLRPALYDAYHSIVNVSKSEIEPSTKYTIAGNICESGDILAEDRLLPESNIGDLLAICDTGAYGMTMASNYNRRALPAEVLIDGDLRHTLIRHRETAQETVEKFLKQTQFK